jgi:hypothetical protein
MTGERPSQHRPRPIIRCSATGASQQFSNILTEVRQDLNRILEPRGELARKEEVDSAFKDLQSVANGQTALRERCLFLEQQLTVAEEVRKQLASEVSELRERLAVAVGVLRVGQH